MGRAAPFQGTAVAAAVLFVSALVAYSNSFSVPFIFDDWLTIVNNPTIRSAWPIWPAFSPVESSGMGGRPVANLSLVLNYAVGGPSVAGFHAVNLAIHFLAGLTLFGVVRRTLLRREAGGQPASRASALALGAAALWLLHPLQTQSVIYIGQRTESLMGLFYFLTLYGFVRAAEAGPGWRWQILGVAACAAGMGTKEGMVTAPAMVFLHDWAFVGGSAAEAWRRRWRLHVALGATWIVLALLMGGLHGRGVGFGHGMDAWSYLLIECRAVVRYLSLGLWPWPLVFDYGTDLGGARGAALMGGAALVALAGATLWAWRRRPALGFVGAWFFITLAPTSSVVPIPLQPISENRAYVPLAAVMVGVVLAIHAWLGRRGFAILAGVAIALAVLTRARNADYRSEVAIWADTAAKRPASARAHGNLGFALQAAGRLPEARVALERALRLRPDYGDAHVNIASVLGRLGMPDRAREHGLRAIQLEPGNVNAFYNLGVACLQLGSLSEAIVTLEAVVRMRPDFGAAHDNLALALLNSGRAAEAVAHSETAVRLDPAAVEARYNLACGLAMAGRHAEAVPLFQAIVRAQPERGEAWTNLGATLRELGRIPEAIEAYAAAQRLDPGSAPVREMLGMLRASEEAARRAK